MDPNSKVNSKMERKMDMENTSGQIAQSIKEIG
jgi:hypothetical protein